MKFKTFLNETSASSRVEIAVTGDWKQRVFFEATLKDVHKNFLQVGKKVLCGEATVDLRVDSAAENKVGEAYINRIDAFPKGQNFGSELLEAIIKALKEQKFKAIRAYVESSNVDSRLLFKKFNFIEVDKQKSGSYFKLQL